MDAPQVSQMDVSNLTGPWALGFIFNSILFGVFIVQVSIYFTHFPKDMTGIKILVWAITVIETFYTIMCCVASWHTFGTGWGNVDALLVFHWSWAILPLLSGLISSPVQCFFAWRIYRLSTKIWPCVPIVVMSFLQCFGIFYYDLRDLADSGATIAGLQKVIPFIELWLIGSAIRDILITIAMVTILVMAASQSPLRQTNQLLTRIAKFTVETNLLTTIGAVVELILYRTMPDNGFHFIFFFILGRLYSNVLLASLNSRILFTAKNSAYSNASASPTRSILWADMSGVSDTYIGQSNVRVNVSTTKVTRGDHEMSVMSEGPSTDTMPSEPFV